MSSNPSRRGFSCRASKNHDEKKKFIRAVYSILSGDDIFKLSVKSLRMPRRYRQRKKRGGDKKAKKGQKNGGFVDRAAKIPEKKNSE